MNTTTINESIVYMLNLDSEKGTSGVFKYLDFKMNYALHIKTFDSSGEPQPIFELSSGEAFPFNTEKHGSTLGLSFVDNDGKKTPFEQHTIEEDKLLFRVGDPDTVTVTVVYDEPPMKGQ